MNTCLMEVSRESLQITCQKRMFILGSHLGRQPAVEVDQPIVSQRLQENGAASRFEYAYQFMAGVVEVQVVQNAVAADYIEMVIRKFQLFCVHYLKGEFVLQPFFACQSSCLPDPFGGDINADNVRAVTSQGKGRLALAAPVFKYFLTCAVFVDQCPVMSASCCID